MDTTKRGSGPSLLYLYLRFKLWCRLWQSVSQWVIDMGTPRAMFGSSLVFTVKRSMVTTASPSSEHNLVFLGSNRRCGARATSGSHLKEVLYPVRPKWGSSFDPFNSIKTIWSANKVSSVWPSPLLLVLSEVVKREWSNPDLGSWGMIAGYTGNFSS